VTLGFILVPAGAVRLAVVCSGHYIALHRGACRGGLKAWRERRLGFQVPKVLIEASANIVVKAESVCVITISRPVPCGWGIASPFIGQGESSLHACHTILLPCGGVASSATELTTVLTNLAPVVASWRVLCSYRSGFEGGGVEVGCPAAARGPARGCRQRGPYEVQCRARQRLVPVRSNSAGDVVIVPGVALQWRGWPHRADSDEEDHSRRPDVTV
jgi:hypothetical protein